VIKPERIWFGSGALSLIILAAAIVAQIRGELTPGDAVALGLLPIALGLFCVRMEYRITGRWFWESHPIGK
jgi:cadmium resistance protein CadD (predicted permease)